MTRVRLHRLHHSGRRCAVKHAPRIGRQTSKAAVRLLTDDYPDRCRAGRHWWSCRSWDRSTGLRSNRRPGSGRTCPESRCRAEGGGGGFNTSITQYGRWLFSVSPGTADGRRDSSDPGPAASPDRSRPPTAVENFANRVYVGISAAGAEGPRTWCLRLGRAQVGKVSAAAALPVSVLVC